mmetsp:Transcript_16089/g.33668  ORF Transcript_16089/g.33668 Transcript_16089/m.33668 type:complete len:225 (-) Transcript_16089:477-1151(-)
MIHPIPNLLCDGAVSHHMPGLPALVTRAIFTAASSSSSSSSTTTFSPRLMTVPANVPTPSAIVARPIAAAATTAATSPFPPRIGTLSAHMTRLTAIIARAVTTAAATTTPSESPASASSPPTATAATTTDAIPPASSPTASAVHPLLLGAPAILASHRFVFKPLRGVKGLIFRGEGEVALTIAALEGLVCKVFISVGSLIGLRPFVAVVVVVFVVFAGRRPLFG